MIMVTLCDSDDIKAMAFNMTQSWNNGTNTSVCQELQMSDYEQLLWTSSAELPGESAHYHIIRNTVEKYNIAYIWNDLIKQEMSCR